MFHIVKNRDMKRILVPTDFSPNADKALNFAVQIARKAGAELLLIHAVETLMADDDFRKMKEKLDAVAASISSSEMVETSTRIFSDSSVNSVINAIYEHKPDLVVMGTNGSSGLKEVIYGSRTAAVIGRSPVPVLAIPLLADWKVPGKILMAVNKFNVPDKLLGPVIKLATYFGSSLQVTVFTDTNDDYVEDFNLHEQKIADFRDMLREKYPETEIHAVHLAGRHFRESLQGWIDKEGIDIVVMLTHKRTLIGSIFNSSMTKKMSYHTNVPLLAIPDNT